MIFHSFPRMSSLLVGAEYDLGDSYLLSRMFQFNDKWLRQMSMNCQTARVLSASAWAGPPAFLEIPRVPL
jgi:hypothetical protein